jgi:hypothetical protein
MNGTTMTTSEIAGIVEELYTTDQNYYRLRYDEDSPQSLGPPCSPDQIAKLEQVFGGALPPSYRAFMELHNGWANFSGAARILTVEDYGSKWVNARLQEFNGLFEEFVPNSPSPIDRHCIPIYLGETEQDFSLIDPSTRRSDGEMQVISFDLTEEVGRDDTFASFLFHRLAIAKRLLERETSGRQG